MNDSPSVRQIERGSYAPHYRKSSAWIFLSSDDSKSSASSFPSGGGPAQSLLIANGRVNLHRRLGLTRLTGK